MQGMEAFSNYKTITLISRPHSIPGSCRATDAVNEGLRLDECNCFFPLQRAFQGVRMAIKKVPPAAFSKVVVL
jgi:hypothetical protein